MRTAKQLLAKSVGELFAVSCRLDDTSGLILEASLRGDEPRHKYHNMINRLKRIKDRTLKAANDLQRFNPQS